MTQFTRKALSGAAIFGSTLLLAACNSSGDSASLAAGPGAAAGSNGKSQVIAGPLDPLQEQVVSGILGDQIGGTLPEPLGPTVQCAADTVNSLLDTPDAILAALTAVPGGGDPAAALQGAADQVVGSLERFAAELQSTLTALAGGEGCVTVAGGRSDGNPLSGNPLAGTPLAPIGDALEPLVAALSGFSNNDGDGEDPNLTSVTSTVAPLLAQLSDGFALVPAEARSAPVLGGLLSTLETATADLSATLPAVGNYDALGTNAGVETLLNNLLSNVLLQVVPVALIDEQTGQDFSSQIQAGIDTATGTLAPFTGQLITPLFNDVLNGAASPLLNPIESLLAQILGNVPLPTGEPATGNPLSGLLGGVAGNGTGTPLDSLLALLTFGADGASLDVLSQATGGAAGGSPLDQLTGLLGGGNGLGLDALLGQLQALTGPIPLVGELVNVLNGLLGTGNLLGGGLLGGNQG